MRKLILFAFLVYASSLSWGVAYKNCSTITTGDWKNASSWALSASPSICNLAVVPGASDTVALTTGVTITVSDTEAAQTLTTAGLGFNTPNCGAAPFTTNCNLVIASGGTLTVNNSTTGGSVTIAGTGGVVVQSGGTFNWGNSGTVAAQVDLTVGALTGVNFQLGSRGGMNGGVAVSNTGGSLVCGHIVCTPGNTSTKFVWKSSGVTGTDTTLMQFGGTSCGGGYISNYAVFETVAGQSAGGNCNITNGGGNNPKFVFGNLVLNNCGDTTNDCTTMTGQSPAESIVESGPVLALHSGKINLTTNSGVSNATTFNLDQGLDIRNPNAAAHVPLTLASSNTTPFSGTRLVSKVTCDVETGGTFGVIQVIGYGFNIGTSSRAGEGSDTMGTVSYNCEPTFDNANALAINHRNSYVAIDTSTSGQTILETDYSQAYSITDSIFDVFGNNIHTIVGLGTSRSSTPNHYDYNFITGEGYEPGDSGEYVAPTGPATASYNILVNGNQNLMVLNQAATEVLTAEHNTLYRQSSGYTGDTANVAGTFVSWQYNAMSLPFFNLSGGKCNNYMAGIAGGTAFVSFTGLVMNNNGYWQMPNSGDTGADTCTPPTGTGVGGLGTFPGGGPVQMSETVRGTIASKTATSGTTAGTLVCSGCTGTTGFQQAGELAVLHGDIVWDLTQNGCAYVNTITNGTTLVTATGKN